MRNAIIIIGFAAFLGVAGFFGGEKLARRRQQAAANQLIGGVSLLYDIKVPPSYRMTSQVTLPEEIAAALKRRIDPSGRLNVQFRPVGETQLEILIPGVAHSGKHSAAQKALTAAVEEFKQTIVDMDQVKAALANLHGDTRLARLRELAGDDVALFARLNNLADLHDQIAKAKAAYATAEKANNLTARNAAADAEARAEVEYDAELKKIDDDKLSLEQLLTYLDLPNVAPEFARDVKINEVKEQHKDSSARLKAIDNLKSADAEARKYQDEIDEITDLKRMLHGSGVLEFHVLVTDMVTPEALAMIERLKLKGPASQAGDTMKWYRIDSPDQFKGQPTYSMDGDRTRKYVLAYTTPNKQLVHNSNANPWALQSATATLDMNGGRAVSFEFDPMGAQLFGALTRNNLHTPLGIVLDDRMISAPTLNSEIGARGIITGGGKNGFSAREVSYLVNTLAAGALPASLSDEPISELNIGSQLAAGKIQEQTAQSGESIRARRLYGIEGGVLGAVIGALMGAGIAAVVGRKS